MFDFFRKHLCNIGVTDLDDSKVIQPAREDGSAAKTAAIEEMMEVKNGAMDEENIQIIQASLLFDGKWYRRRYGFGEYLNAAEHYLSIGWKEGKNPSELFSTNGYLEKYPEVKSRGINPLLHFEKEGYKKGYYCDEIEKMHDKIVSANRDCKEDIQDGLLRIRITNACNAKCRYCGVRLGFGPEKEHAMDPKWYYEYCKPLYEKLKIVLVTGGDAFIAKESYNYMKFLSDNYPYITVMTESNGIAFDSKFQELAAKNLFKTHFSLNASNARIYDEGCWEGAGGDVVYPKFMRNINGYIDLLKQEDKISFAPGTSMVINKDNAEDILDFVKLSLTMHAWYIAFYFDYTENNMDSDYFGVPESSRKALKILMELERLLEGQVFIYFRLWIPFKEAEPMQQIVEAESLDVLKDKYAEILLLASGRSVSDEWTTRNVWRRKMGKAELSMDEDFFPTIRLGEKNNMLRCTSPWKLLDIYPSGRMDFCSWVAPTLDFNHFIKGDIFDWEKVLNSFEYMSARKRILNNNYQGCMRCCPMNDSANPVTSVYKYGCDRELLK